MLCSYFIWLKEENLERVRTNIADDEHCKIREIVRENGYLCNACKIKFKVVRLLNQINILDSIDVLTAKWHQFYKIDSDKDNGNEELNETDMSIESGAYSYYLYWRWSQLLPWKAKNWYLQNWQIWKGWLQQ